MSATELPKLEELFIAGAQLSNCAFNLAQGDRLDGRVRKSLGECQKRWDDAFAERTSLRLALQANVDLAAESERLRAAAQELSDWSWSLITLERPAQTYLQSLIDNLRAALAAKDSP